MSARRTAALALLALALVSVTGSAAGQPIPITPRPSSPAVPEGFRTTVSDRGGVVTVDRIEPGFVGLTDGTASVVDYTSSAGGTDAAFVGTAVAVSGDSCTVLSARHVVEGDDQSETELFLERRCAGTPPQPIAALGRDVAVSMALDFRGTRAAIGVWREDGPDVAQVIGLSPPYPVTTLRLDGPSEVDPELGIDISDDGRVALTVAFGAADEHTVAVWYTTFGDDEGALQFLTEPGAGFEGWSAFPSISGDGRWVSLVSTGAFSGEEDGFGPWVYRLALDEPEPRLVSPPGESAVFTSMSRDGSQIAYVVGLEPSCTEVPRELQGADTPFEIWDIWYEGVFTDLCQPIQIEVAYGPRPGDDLTREVVVPARPAGVPRAMRYLPQLSGNGRWLTFIEADGALGFPLHAMRVRRDGGLSATDVGLGTTPAGSTTSGSSTVTNTGVSSVSLDRIAVDRPGFAVSGGSCVVGRLLGPGATCTVDVSYTPPPGANGATSSTLVVGEAGFDPVSTRAAITATATTTTTSSTTTTTVPTIVTVPGSTTTTTSLPTGGSGGVVVTTTTTTTTLGTPVLVARPDPVDFGEVAFGIASDVRRVVVANTGTAPARPVAATSGGDAGDFDVVGGTCRVIELRPGATCEFDLRLTASSPGVRSTELLITAVGAGTSVRLTGTAFLDPRLDVTPRAVQSRNVAVVVGQGFPAGSTIDVTIALEPPAGAAPPDATVAPIVLTATANELGGFRLPYRPRPELGRGQRTISVDAVPDVHDRVGTELLVVLSTFSPQGPAGPVFGSQLIVNRR